MRKSGICCFLLLVLSFEVNATDYAARWSLSGIDDYTELRLDLDIGTFSVAAHGLVVLENGNGSAWSGSCFFGGDGNGIACSLTSAGNHSLFFEVDDSLNGTIKRYDRIGNVKSVGTITFLGLGRP